jgi:hypothetical protein
VSKGSSHPGNTVTLKEHLETIQDLQIKGIERVIGLLVDRIDRETNLRDTAMSLARRDIM